MTKIALRPKIVLTACALTLMASGTLAFANEVPEVNYLVENIGRDMNVNISKYGIFVDGKPVGYLDSESEAESILDTLKMMYIDEDSTDYEVTFKEEVTVIKDSLRIMDQDRVFTREELLDYIIRGTTERRIHKVEKGENFWFIAERYGIPVDNLLKANPLVVPERLQIGQEISLIVPKPLITVVGMEEKIYSENIPYEIEYEDSAEYYKDDFRIKISGAYGEMEIVANVYKENGIESYREIVSETVVKEPKTRVVYRGTKDPPPRIGTGTFSYPFDTSRGRVTSTFGSRFHPIYRRTMMHTGIDIAMPTGSLIYAADGGKVVDVGYSGGYGLMVKIDHGENIETLYAHLSDTYVSVGDKVFKGEKIALSGNTGTSTGPHLHFEVRKLGTAINPANYLSFVF
ncbi:MAG: hypothetical protein AVO33_03300 [delta proteobacterium ML8_F1]|nr:MAG: hypothetical protein AVO33_03300 [delta proteobacterium ML8_F1]